MPHEAEKASSHDKHLSGSYHPFSMHVGTRLGYLVFGQSVGGVLVIAESCSEELKYVFHMYIHLAKYHPAFYYSIYNSINMIALFNDEYTHHYRAREDLNYTI